MARTTGPETHDEDDEDDGAVPFAPDTFAADEDDDLDDEGAGALPFDVSPFADPDALEAFPLGGCEVKGRGGAKARRPFRGQSMWLAPYTPAGLENGLAALVTYVGQVQLASEQGDGATLPDANLDALFASVKCGLSRVVAGWDAVDPNTGRAYPQPWNNAGVWDEVPTELLYFVAGVVRTGEVPEDRPNARMRGRGGSGTARRTGSTTRTTGPAPRRR